MNAPIGRSAPAAIRGTFAHFALIRTRDTAQFVIEVPGADADAALAALGGLPRPGEERWVAVARLNPDAPTPAMQEGQELHRKMVSERPVKKRWGEYSCAQQAGIRCADPRFREWLLTYRPSLATAAHEDHPDDPEEAAAAMVRTICLVSSRSLLDRQDYTRRAWLALDAAFQQEVGLMATEPGR